MVLMQDRRLGPAITDPRKMRRALRSGDELERSCLKVTLAELKTGRRDT
jgi:hypothetical protein